MDFNHIDGLIDELDSSILIWGKFADHNNAFIIKSANPYCEISQASYVQYGEVVNDISFRMKKGFSFRIWNFDLFVGNAQGFIPVHFNIESPFDSSPRNYGQWMMTPESNMLRLKTSTSGPYALDINCQQKATLLFMLDNLKQLKLNDGFPFYINLKGLLRQPTHRSNHGTSIP